MAKAELNFDEKREALLLAALPIVAFDGWTEHTMAQAAEAAGIAAGEGALLFPRGTSDLIEAYSDWADAQMLARLDAVDIGTMKIRERITFAVRARLEVLVPHREATRRATSLLALPTNAVLASKMLYRTTDKIWRGIGDTSTDFNFYTKRATLAGVYSTTLLAWLNDSSEEAADTWAFLDRRIEDVMRIEKVKAKVRKVTSRLPSPAQFLSAVRYPGPSVKR
jgi:ubiquinone biosynthesis protein COQ9